jgi:NAD(P)-dependent dehydrogenase (short-subunit alcohol dehydrogenase family)
MPGLSLLINNASIFERADIKSTDAGFLARHLAINLQAPFLLTRDFARHCKKGSIINLLDAKLDKHIFNYAAYYLTKTGLAELTRLAAREFGPRIRVNGIAPGPILPAAGETRRSLVEKARALPLQRPGSVRDICAAVEFLLKNDYLTGQILYIDGGQNL